MVTSRDMKAPVATVQAGFEPLCVLNVPFEPLEFRTTEPAQIASGP
jgi:hypothetical protein